MQADLVVIDARALNLWPAHDPITPVPSPRIRFRAAARTVLIPRPHSQAAHDLLDVADSDEAVGRFGEGGGLSPATEDHVIAAPPARSFIGIALQDGAGAGQHTASPSLGEVGKPRRRVDGVANHGVFVAVLGTDIAGKDATVCDTDPEIGHAIVHSQSVAQRPGGTQCFPSGVVQTCRCAEDGQSSVTFKLVDVSAIGVDDGDNDAKKSIEDISHILRRIVRSKRGGSGEVSMNTTPTPHTRPENAVSCCRAC
jgi:hypothetical protein